MVRDGADVELEPGCFARGGSQSMRQQHGGAEL
jgi:hypothetical protein